MMISGHDVMVDNPTRPAWEGECLRLTSEDEIPDTPKPYNPAPQSTHQPGPAASTKKEKSTSGNAGAPPKSATQGGAATQATPSSLKRGLEEDEGFTVVLTRSQRRKKNSEIAAAAIAQPTPAKATTKANTTTNPTARNGAPAARSGPHRGGKNQTLPIRTEAHITDWLKPKAEKGKSPAAQEEPPWEGNDDPVHGTGSSSAPPQSNEQ